MNSEHMITLPSLNTMLRLVFQPYFNRLRLGEGGLVLFNLVHLWFAEPSVSSIITLGLVSFLVMCALYGYNDLIDVEIDKINPKKNKRFIALIEQNKTTLAILLLAIFIICNAVLFWFKGWYGLVSIALLFITNTIYSNKVKSIPVLDILTVCVWGGLYASIAGKSHYVLYTSVGLMTGIAHVFQIITDEKTDAVSGIQTSAVKLAPWLPYILFCLCALLFLCFWNILQFEQSITAFIPFIAYLFMQQVIYIWYLSRFVFVFLWLTALFKLYAVS